MTNFSKWDQEFKAQNLYAFNGNSNGLLWLKVRAVCRSKQLKQFVENSGITLSTSKISEQSAELFGILEKMPNAMRLLDEFLNNREYEWYEALGIDEKRLKDDLYKIHQYTWGGDQNNSLDKHLIKRYVKVISSYDELAGRQAEIADNAWNYVLTSWYNNWTSYLIEALFKRHAKVISAVGEIKSVDFFIKDKPIDLKVTFFPSQYMDEKLKAKLGKKEISWLKQKAKENNITYDSRQTEAQQIYTISEKLSEIGRGDILAELRTARKDIINEARNDTTELMTWLYANQGEMRFGAENRLFLILVDANDITQSWKMKRAFALIEPKVNKYLEDFTDTSLKNIVFKFKGKTYRSLADVLFVIKE